MPNMALSLKGMSPKCKESLMENSGLFTNKWLNLSKLGIFANANFIIIDSATRSEQFPRSLPLYKKNILSFKAY